MIGVCIKYFHENYGGMLQAYATVSILKEMGIDYELIQYKKSLSVKEKVKSIPRLINGILLNDKYETFKKKRGLKKHPEFAKNEAIRKKAFKEFNEEHFTKLSPVFVGYENLKKGAERYEAVLTGSDQLWSPAGLPTNFYNLMFVPDNIRKISYASSFGVKQIPWYQKKRTSQYLRRIDYISMREKRGSEIVKELTGRQVPTILDPVFMFDRSGWEKLIPTKKLINSHYIFAYFLGNNPEYRRAVKQAAKELDCQVVVLRHLDQYIPADETFGDIAPYNIAPDQFLNLLRGASYVCTDSFHGSCFSIIYRKPFVIFNRYLEESKHSKNSRIDTLCENLDLQDRRYQSMTSLSNQLTKRINYEAVEEKFIKIKKETDNYLKVAFRGISREQ